ncbi:hypothetical protein [Pseudoroseomonas ludipueritiae]|nr:hypothetical protein [Pseudoroseomonas ludipueritiae]
MLFIKRVTRKLSAMSLPALTPGIVARLQGANGRVAGVAEHG